ncbi:uncharacterized protein K02A2.6-like [Corticium candelabrum]|uniref:uncharacterized protein K02A2.6-like n=1 Tax=Corticium candelabrum TaxID=121492 RepID=UPI002E26BEBB|nr:uncharacterized protein K02A2.6-like [Corticium candelabrum]
MLSRLPLQVDVIDPNEQIYGINYMEQLPITAKEVAKETALDPVLRKVFTYTLRGWPYQRDTELLPYSRKANELSVDNGCLLWGQRVVIPASLRSRVLQELHLEHPGVNRMKALARSFVWWVNLDKDIEELVKTCEQCQNARHRPSTTNPPHPWLYPNRPWERVHCDLAEFGGRQYFVMMDAYSKWPDIYDLGTSASTTKVIDALRRSFSSNGLPERLVSDNGPQFISLEFRDFVQSNGIRHQLTPPYHPASNGQAERLVQELKKSLRGKPAARSWSHQLSLFLLHYRSTPHTTTGKSPAELQLKRTLRTRLDLLFSRGQADLGQQNEQQFQEASSQVRELIPGEAVGVWNPRRDGRGNWLYGTVMQKVGPTNYMIEVEGHVRYVHIDHLRQRDSRSMSGGLPTPEQTDIPITPTSSKELIPPVISVTQESDAVEIPGRVKCI